MNPEFTQVILTTDLPEKSLKAGDVGVIVHVLDGGKGYVIEFFKLDGSTFTVATVFANQIIPVGKNHLLHVRELAD